jgi:hypothetical protein
LPVAPVRDASFGIADDTVGDLIQITAFPAAEIAAA